jgi:lysophospholipase L1-like esterase
MGREKRSKFANDAKTTADLASSLAQKVTKGAGDIKMVDLHTEVKTAMTGGSVPVVGLNAVGAENVKPKAITPDKISFFNYTIVNLLDLTKMVDGFISSTGTVIAEPSAKVTDFIPVEEGQSYTTVSGTWDSGYYDSNKAFVQRVQNTDGKYTVPTGLGIAYIRVSMNASNVAANPMFVKGTTYPTFYTTYGDNLIEVADPNFQKLLDKQLEGIQVEPNQTTFFKAEKINLVDKTKMTVGYLNSTTGAIEGSGSYASDFIEVVENQAYSTNGTYYMGFYDSNKVYVIDKPSGFVNFTIPTGLSIKYARAVFETTSQYPEAMFVKGSSLPSSYISYESLDNLILSLSTDKFARDINKQMGSKWKGKKWNALGDSITFGAGATKPYHSFSGEDLGVSLVRNYGISGSTITKKDVDDTTQSMALRYTSMDNDADLITVLAGVNDVAAVPLGTMSDRTVDTYYGACHVLFSGLLNKYPTKTIGALTQLQRQDGYSLQKPYLEAYKEVCEFYGIPCLDLFGGSGIYPNTQLGRDTYIPDGWHPNGAGHRVMANKITAFLNSI